LTCRSISGIIRGMSLLDKTRAGVQAREPGGETVTLGVHRRRPALVTAVGVIGIIAGSFPLVELIALLVSAQFAGWFLPLVQSILPVSVAVTVVSMFVIAVADIAFGIGVLTAKRWACYGMIARSIIAVPFDYLNFTAGNRAGAFVGFAVSVCIVWALLLADSRSWFSAQRS
jgi:hypothetical protein